MFTTFKQAGMSGLGDFIVAKVEMRQMQKAIGKVLETAEGKTATKALAAVGKLGKNKVKATIPGKYKGVRKAIGWRHVKRKYNSGQRAVKVGGGVGPNLLRKNITGRGRALTAKQRDRQNVLREKVATSVKNRKSSKRPGVGIDGNNVHWWFLGTNTRTTGTKTKTVGGRRGRNGWKGVKKRFDTGAPKRNRGKMPPQARPVMVIMASASGEIREAIRVHMKQGIAIEAAKHK